MMFHLEAQQKLTRQEGLEEISQEEIQGGQVIVGASRNTNSVLGNSRRSRQRKH